MRAHPISPSRGPRSCLRYCRPPWKSRGSPEAHWSAAYSDRTHQQPVAASPAGEVGARDLLVHPCLAPLGRSVVVEVNWPAGRKLRAAGGISTAEEPPVAAMPVVKLHRSVTHDQGSWVASLAGGGCATELTARLGGTSESHSYPNVRIGAGSGYDDTRCSARAGVERPVHQSAIVDQTHRVYPPGGVGRRPDGLHRRSGGV